MLAAAGWFYKSRLSGGEAIDSVAVLPFVNASADPNAEYLSDGITESLINSLSTLPHLKVMSRDSAFMYKGKDTDAKTVGQTLGVRAVLKGRVMQRGDDLEISAELVDARDNSHIWGQQYSRKASDIFALQGELAKEMTSMLRMRLTGEEEKRMMKSSTANPEAYQDYLKGRYWWNKRSEDGVRTRASNTFSRPSPMIPLTHLPMMAWPMATASSETTVTFHRRTSYPRAKEAVLKALQLDDTLAEAHTSLAFIMSDYDWDWPGAEREFQRSLALNPNYAYAHALYGYHLYKIGQFDKAIAEGERALELDPLSLIANRILGQSYYYARKYDQAIEQYRKTLDLDPNFTGAHRFLGMAYVQKSMYKEGLAEMEKEIDVSHGSSAAISELGHAYAAAGRRSDAQKCARSTGRDLEEKVRYGELPSHNLCGP